MKQDTLEGKAKTKNTLTEHKNLQKAFTFAHNERIIKTVKDHTQTH